MRCTEPNFRLLNNIGHNLQQLNRYEEAFNYYEDAVEYLSETPMLKADIYSEIGICLITLDRIEEGKSALKIAMKTVINPGQLIEIQKNVSNTLKKYKKYNEDYISILKYKKRGKKYYEKKIIKSEETAKLIKLFVLCLILQIPLLFVRGVIKERSDLYRNATFTLGNEWGKKQIVTGPVILLPYSETYSEVETIEDNGEKKREIKKTNSLSINFT